MKAPQLSETEGDELMDAISDIMFAFVDLGFGVHAVQLVNSEQSNQNELAELAQKFVRRAA